MGGGGVGGGGRGVGLGGLVEGGQAGCAKRKLGGVWGVGLGGRVGGVRVDVNEELKFCENLKKKKIGGGVGGVGLGVQGGCERRIEVFGKIHKKKSGVSGLGGGGGVRWVSGWWGVRVDVNEELKF